MQAHRNYISLSLAIAVAALWLGNVAYYARTCANAEVPVVELAASIADVDRVEVRQRAELWRDSGTFDTAAGTVYEHMHFADNGDVILNLCGGAARIDASGGQAHDGFQTEVTNE